MRTPSIRVLIPAALICLAGFAWSRSSQAPTDTGPTAEQKRLDPLVGEWDAKLTIHSPMGAMESVGVEKNRMICGGKWLESSFQSEFQGMPFEGRALMGYDAEKKAYAGVWIDNMTPAFTVMEGKWSDADKGMTWTYPSKDMQGKSGTTRNTEVMTDANTRMAKFFFTPEGGKEELSMEFQYRRKGAGKPAEASSDAKKSPTGG